MRPLATAPHSSNARTKNCALVLFGAGVVLYFVGLSTDYWAHSGVMHYGLWRNCRGLRGCELFQEDFVHDWMIQSRRYMTVAGVLHVLTTAALVLQARRRRDLHPLDAVDLQWPLTFYCLILVAGALVLATVRVFYKGVFFPAAVYVSWWVSLLSALCSLSCVLICRLPGLVQNTLSFLKQRCL